MREGDAIELLSRKMDAEGYLTIPQVRNATGFNAGRTADALMIQTWPSRTLSITGVEYKCSRADWRRELEDGEKAETIAAYCHYWLVLAPKGVVPIEEVPVGWGLWELDKNGRLLRTKAPPPQIKVKSISLSFMVAILRSAEKINRRDRALEADRKALHTEFEKRVQALDHRRTREYKDLSSDVEAFEQASGIRISRGWGLGRLGAGVRKFIDDPEQFTRSIEQNRNSLRQILATMDAALEKKEGPDHA